MSSAEKLKLELKRVRDEFKMSESDCGSARVQGNEQIRTSVCHTNHASCFSNYRLIVSIFIVVDISECYILFSETTKT